MCTVVAIILFITTSRSSRTVGNEYERLGRSGHIVLIYVFAVLVIPFFGLLAQLLGFHVMLSESLWVLIYISDVWSWGALYILEGTTCTNMTVCALRLITDDS